MNQSGEDETLETVVERGLRRGRRGLRRRRERERVRDKEWEVKVKVTFRRDTKIVL